MEMALWFTGPWSSVTVHLHTKRPPLPEEGTKKTFNCSIMDWIQYRLAIIALICPVNMTMWRNMSPMMRERIRWLAGLCNVVAGFQCSINCKKNILGESATSSWTLRLELYQSFSRLIYHWDNKSNSLSIKLKYWLNVCDLNFYANILQSEMIVTNMVCEFYSL